MNQVNSQKEVELARQRDAELATLQERERLARDLHDGLGGLLSGVKLQLGAMKGNLILSEEHARVFNNALGKLDRDTSIRAKRNTNIRQQMPVSSVRGLDHRVDRILRFADESRKY